MEVLQDEVESLEAILMDDVRITRNPENNMPEMIETTIYPEICDDTEQQYICVTLQVIPSIKYPDVSPKYILIKPRGLDDQRLDLIKTACNEKLEESIGYPVVFDLIEIVREHLSGSNLPSGQCVICLYGFSEGDEFTKTECFHYLHSYCLSRHLIASRRNYQEELDKLPAWLQKTAEPFQAVCPVCREAIKNDSDSLKCAMPPAELQNAPEFKLTDDLKELQKKMSDLFLLQKSRGAIIDTEVESGTFISIEPEEESRQNHRSKNNKHSNHKSNNEATTFTPAPERSNDQNVSNGSKRNDRSSTSTNFAPIVTPTQKITTDPTNNNYHHGRRHYRGGRRHQNHHHHHHRDRHENQTSSNSTNSQSTQEQQSAPPSSTSTSTNHSGGRSNNSSKQQKGHMTFTTKTR